MMGIFMFIIGGLLFSGCIQSNNCDGIVALISLFLIIFGYKKMKKKKTTTSYSYYEDSYSSNKASGLSNLSKEAARRGAVWSSEIDPNCEHIWEFSHLGADGNRIYECMKCGSMEKRM